MKATYFMVAAIAMTMASCGSDETANEVQDTPVEARISAGVDSQKATDTRAIDQTWSGNESIGVMVISSTSGMADLYKNVKYDITSQKGTSANFSPATAGQGIVFQNTDETVTFAAYCPYQASAAANELPGTDGKITGAATQVQTTQAEQETFDYLFASGATASKASPSVTFTGENYAFKHKMACLILILKTSVADGFTAEQVKGGTYTLSGLKHTGTFDVTNGTAEATGAVVSDWNITANYHTDAPNIADGRTYSMILYPQNLSGTGAALAFNANIGGQNYQNTDLINPNLEAGKSYTYTITMKKTGLEISGCTIAPWEVGEAGKDGDAIMK